MRYVSYNLRLNPTLIVEAGRASWSFCMSSEGLLSHRERSANQRDKTSIHIRRSQFNSLRNLWCSRTAIVYPKQIHLVHFSAVKAVQSRKKRSNSAECELYTPPPSALESPCSHMWDDSTQAILWPTGLPLKFATEDRLIATKGIFAHSRYNDVCINLISYMYV